MRPSDLLKNVLLAVLVTLPTVEAASWLGMRFLASRGFVYRPLEIDESTFRDYREKRDPLLGWSPAAASADEIYDAHGARRSPAFPTSADRRACVAAFGDSFTFGADVAAEDAFPNQLAELLDCPVRNFAVPGYGTDQALLRFRSVSDDAPVVVLGHHSVDIVRNVNRFRNFLGGAVGIGLKPRFALRDGELVLVPIPDPVSADAVNALGLEGARLEDEYFQPGGPAGQVRGGFPYTAALVAFASSWRVRALWAGVPAYAPFYADSHPSGALPLTVAILAAFDAEARARGQQPVVLVLPGDKDLAALRDGGEAFHQPLVRALAERGISVPDVTGAMLAHLNGHDLCDLFVDCNGHYTPEANRVVAEVLARWIEDLVPTRLPADGTRESGSIPQVRRDPLGDHAVSFAGPVAVRRQ